MTGDAAAAAVAIFEGSSDLELGFIGTRSDIHFSKNSRLLPVLSGTVILFAPYLFPLGVETERSHEGKCWTSDPNYWLDCTKATF